MRSWRFEVIRYLSPWLILILIAIATGILIIFGGFYPHPFLVQSSSVVALAVTFFLTYRYYYELSRRLRAGGGMFCLRCGHGLHGIGETGVCPGCGRLFEIVKVRQGWRRIAQFDDWPHCQFDGIDASSCDDRKDSGSSVGLPVGRSNRSVVHGQFSEMLRIVAWLLIPAVAILAISGLRSFHTPIINQIPVFIYMVAMGMAVLLGVYLIHWRKKILGQKLRAGDGKFCLNCGYDLHDLGDSGNCPECGDPFEIAIVQNSWSGLMGIR